MLLAIQISGLNDATRIVHVPDEAVILLGRFVPHAGPLAVIPRFDLDVLPIDQRHVRLDAGPKLLEQFNGQRSHLLPHAELLLTSVAWLGNQKLVDYIEGDSNVDSVHDDGNPFLVE